MLCVVHVRLKKVRSYVRIDCNVAHNQSIYLSVTMHDIRGEEYAFTHMLSFDAILRQFIAQVKSLSTALSNFTASVELDLTSNLLLTHQSS
jgi:hypothetical protein